MSSKLNHDIQYAWVIRAGRQGKAHDYFVKNNLVVLEKQDLGNLLLLQNSRDAFYLEYQNKFPDSSRFATRGIGGKFYRFVYEIKVGDIIIYPCINDRNIYIGKSVSGYEYVENDLYYPHQRKVKWSAFFEKSKLSKSACYEMNTARTLFRYIKNIEEILSLIEMKL